MLKELIIPAKELTVVKKFTGGKERLGYVLKQSVWNERSLPNAVILGVTDSRISEHSSLANSPDAIRHQLYSLFRFSDHFNIVDLGNVITGKESSDTFSAVRMIADELATLKVPLLLLGGSQHYTSALVTGLNKYDPVVTIIDDRIDNRCGENSAKEDMYINVFPAEAIINFMGIQSFFVPFLSRDMVSEEYGGTLLTLGEIRKDIKDTEPHLRETDIVSFDYGSLRLSDAPGQLRNSPNGFSGEEACQLAWYSGIATKPVWFSIFGYDPELDPTLNGAMLSAQIAWYFLYGVSKKIDQVPEDEAIDFQHFIIPIEGLQDPVTFLKHPVSKRWWMEVPSPDCDLFPLRIPCSKKDYKKACRNEIPERWWNNFNKTY